MARKTRRRTTAKKARERARRTAAPKRRAMGTGSRSTKSRTRAKRTAGTQAKSQRSTGSRIARLTAGRLRHGTAPSAIPEAENLSVGDISVIPPLLVEEVETIRVWKDAQSMVGDEKSEGTVDMSENDRVDEIASRPGVERAPNAPLRTSGEILNRRDRGGRKPPRAIRARRS